MDSIIGYKLRRAQLAVFQDFLDTFAAMRLRPAEFSILSLIGTRPGRKQAEIAESLGIKPANLVPLIDAMEKRGLAERRRGDSDRRTFRLYLTLEGEGFVARMHEVWQAHERRFVDRLGGEAERDRLIAMLDRILTP
jgi:DNA-binding MarR family transcriptional regulator